MKRRLGALAVSLLGLFVACKGTEPSTAQRAAEGVASDAPPRSYAAALIRDVPHVEQKPDFCGEAATEMYLRKLGKNVDQDAVFALASMDPARGMGATTKELKTALSRLGFDVGPVWHTVDSSRARSGLDEQFDALHADLSRGVPSIVCMHYDDRPGTTEHFRLILGYDPATDEVVYHEPAERDGAYRRMARRTLLELWPLKYERDRWTVIRFRLDADEISAPSAPAGHSPADFAQHVMKLRKRLPPGFTVVVEPPFVVVGNDSPDRVATRAQGTVRWAVSRLKRDFFTKDPAKILDIWLFRDRPSYEKLVPALFGSEPSTPYGYYSSSDGALVMNIATGGGTLVHEIVHPFMESNFPDHPAWFNEGLGSLYEQSADRNGHIVGLTNWRLAGLQQAIRRGSLPSFAELTSTTSREFYDDDPGSNYAQARYLLYYLQERGLLVEYYRRFHRSRRTDPTGYRTLVDILGRPDMAAFQKRWERYVLGLRFPS